MLLYSSVLVRFFIVFFSFLFLSLSCEFASDVYTISLRIMVIYFHLSCIFTFSALVCCLPFLSIFVVVVVCFLFNFNFYFCFANTERKESVYVFIIWMIRFKRISFSRKKKLWTPFFFCWCHSGRKRKGERKIN